MANEEGPEDEEDLNCRQWSGRANNFSKERGGQHHGRTRSNSCLQAVNIKGRLLVKLGGKAGVRKDLEHKAQPREDLEHSSRMHGCWGEGAEVW